MLKRVLSVAVLAVFAVSAMAQEKQPRGKAEVMVQGKKVSVDYGRPVLKGRSAEDLKAKLPEDRMWRAGMDQVTTLTTETDLMVGTKKVPAGKYSVYVHIPQSGDWSLVLNSVLGQPLVKVWAEAPPNVANEPWPHFNYSKEIADKEVARAAMSHGKVDPPADVFTIDLVPAQDGATMKMSWGAESWSSDLKAAK